MISATCIRTVFKVDLFRWQETVHLVCKYRSEKTGSWINGSKFAVAKHSNNYVMKNTKMHTFHNNVLHQCERCAFFGFHYITIKTHRSKNMMFRIITWVILTHNGIKFEQLIKLLLRESIRICIYDNIGSKVHYILFVSLSKSLWSSTQ